MKTKDILAVFGTVALVVCALGLAGLAHSLQRANHPVAEGEAFLRKKGYRQISGGDVKLFHGCGKDVFARSYSVTDPDGTRENRTVCFTPFFGPRFPLLGK